MNPRLLVAAFAALLALIIAAAFAFTSSAENASTSQTARPIAGITGEVVDGVPDAELDQAARTFFASLVERTYRGQDVPIAAATPDLAARWNAIAVTGKPTSQPRIATVRFKQGADGIRDVTARVDEDLSDESTQPLSAYFRRIDGRWTAVAMRTLDDVAPDAPSTTGTGPAAPAAARAAAEAYALAARSWTPDTLVTQHRKQLRRSRGRLRQELQRSAPSPAQVDAYRQARTRAEAEVADLQAVRVSPERVTFSITLTERAIADDVTDQQTTVNTAELELVGGRWLVSTFTASP